MKVVVLDGNTIDSVLQIHDRFATTFSFPGWYGNNLDALYDCLTDISTPCAVLIRHEAVLVEKLGNRGTALLKLLQRASDENPAITLANES